MRAVIQRVIHASVEIEDKVFSEIDNGILALIGFHHDDEDGDVEYIINKILGLRIFDDENGVMNLSVTDINRGVLLVPQFTLYGDVRKGKRPSYSTAMTPDKALPFFDEFIAKCRLKYRKIECGKFGANMKVSLTNSGPVTILIDSKKMF